MASVIEHKAIVSDIQGHNMVLALQGDIDCDTCQAKSLCHLATEERKLLEVPILKKDAYRIGDKLTVSIPVNKAFKSIGVLYLVPFLVVLLTFGTSIYFKLPANLGLLISLFSLVPLFVMIFYYKEKSRKDFHFKVVGER